MSTLPANTTLTHIDPAKDREQQTRPLSLKLIARLIGYMKPYARRRNMLFALVLMRSMLLPTLAAVTSRIINGPITSVAGQARDGEVVNYMPIWLGVGGFALLCIFTQVSFHFRQRMAMDLGESVVHDLRNELFGHLQRMTMGFYDRTKLGRIISRATGDIESVRMGVQDVLFRALLSVGQISVAAVMMLWSDWRLFLALMAMAPVLWSIRLYFKGRMSVAHRNTRESFSRVTANLAESVSGIRVTQGFVRQRRNASMFGALVGDHATHHMVVARLRGVFSPMLDMTNQFFTALLFLVGGFMLLRGKVEVDVLIFFLFLSGIFFMGVMTIGNLYANSMEAMAGAERLFNLLDTPPQWTDPPDAIKLTAIRGRVQFRDVSFGYDTQRLVLHDLSFDVQPGQTVALVGHTGCGKSSIVNLITKFYLSTEGQLLIDGYDIHDVDSDSLHRHMGIVLQQNFLFTGTVMDNIRFAKPDADDQQVAEAARKLGCLDIIENLPESFDTPVGERGGNLSLGQRQLVCFTRAMLADPSILILDEATSSVDSMTEARIQHALEVLLQGRTSFVVAHRLSTIRHADVVLVLDLGRIVERGTHNQLLATGGVYANLYRQFIQSYER